MAPVTFEFLEDITGTFVPFFLIMCAGVLISMFLTMGLPFETKDILLSGDFFEDDDNTVRRNKSYMYIF